MSLGSVMYLEASRDMIAFAHLICADSVPRLRSNTSFGEAIKLVVLVDIVVDLESGRELFRLILLTSMVLLRFETSSGEYFVLSNLRFALVPLCRKELSWTDLGH